MIKIISFLNRDKADNDRTDIGTVIADLQNNLQADMANNNMTEPDRIYIYVVAEKDTVTVTPGIS